MKVILDCNIWISFLIGHQAQLVRRILTDLRFDVYVCDRLIEEIRDVAARDKICKRVTADEVDYCVATEQPLSPQRCYCVATRRPLSPQRCYCVATRRPLSPQRCYCAATKGRLCI